jgi:hypothetical protein
MAKVEVNQNLVGQRVTMPDGSKTKIDRVLSNKYVLSNGERVQGHELYMKGRSLMCDPGRSRKGVADSGEGYGVAEEVETKKSGGKTDKGSDKKPGGKRSKAVEPDDEEEEEEEERPRKSKSKPKKAVEPAETDDDELEQPAVTVTVLDASVANTVRDLTKAALFGALSSTYENFNPGKSSVGVQFNSTENQLVINVGAMFDLKVGGSAGVVFTTKTAKAVTKGLWEKLVRSNHKAVASICGALQTDELEIESYLVDEEGVAFVFAGANLVDSSKLNLVLQSLDGETVLLQNVTKNLGQLDKFDVQSSIDATDEDEDEFAGLADEEEADDEEEAEEADGDEVEDVLKGMDEEEFAEILDDMEAQDIIDHLTQHWEVDEEELDAMKLPKLKQYITACYFPEGDDEEEDEEDEEDGEQSSGFYTQEELREMSSTELEEIADGNDIELPDEFYKNGKIRPTKSALIAEHLINIFFSDEEEEEEDEEDENPITEEYLKGLKFEALIEIAEDNEVSVPTIVIKTRNVKRLIAILVEALVAEEASELEEDENFKGF